MAILFKRSLYYSSDRHIIQVIAILFKWSPYYSSNLYYSSDRHSIQVITILLKWSYYSSYRQVFQVIAMFFSAIITVALVSFLRHAFKLIPIRTVFLPGGGPAGGDPKPGGGPGGGAPWGGAPWGRKIARIHWAMLHLNTRIRSCCSSWVVFTPVVKKLALFILKL